MTTIINMMMMITFKMIIMLINLQHFPRTSPFPTRRSEGENNFVAAVVQSRSSSRWCWCWCWWCWWRSWWGGGGEGGIPINISNHITQGHLEERVSCSLPASWPPRLDSLLITFFLSVSFWPSSSKIDIESQQKSILQNIVDKDINRKTFVRMINFLTMNMNTGWFFF